MIAAKDKTIADRDETIKVQSDSSESMKLLQKKDDEIAALQARFNGVEAELKSQEAKQQEFKDEAKDAKI